LEERIRREIGTEPSLPLVALARRLRGKKSMHLKDGRLEEDHDRPSPELLHPYCDYAERGRWAVYASTLEEEGPAWILDLQIPRVIEHLTLFERTQGEDRITPILAFLKDAVDPKRPPELMKGYFNEYRGQRRHDLAAASAFMGVLKTWISGLGLRRLDGWIDPIMGLLEDEQVGKLQRAALLTALSVIHLISRADLQRSFELNGAARAWTAKAKAASLQVKLATIHGLVLLVQGEHYGLKLLLQDTQPHLETGDISPLSMAQFNVLVALHALVSGRPEEYSMDFGRLIPESAREHLPPAAAVLLKKPRLMGGTSHEHGEALKALSQTVRAADIKRWNYYGCAWAHYYLSMSFIATGYANEALLHGRESIAFGQMSEGALPVIVAALPVGQALVDLGRLAEAEEFLSGWVETWTNKGFNYFAACGSFELAQVSLSNGNRHEAGEHLERASRLMPKGVELHVPNRSEGSFRKLREGLVNAPDTANN
jgi:tetratricopeptide (TPR) repeat protein